METLTVIILVRDEEIHIERCIRSVADLANQIVVVDGGSTDRTIELARRCDAVVLNNEWVNHSVQFNYALDAIEYRTDWVLRLDADEVVLPELADAIRLMLSSLNEAIHGYTVNRRIHFMGRWIRHGGVYPVRTTRLFRDGRGRMESRWMDEHILVNGTLGHINQDIVDINLQTLTWWTAKHNSYASKECAEIILAKHGEQMQEEDGRLSISAAAVRWAKDRVYYSLPIGVRPALYFLYRYIFKLGFLDGRQGFFFHLLQGFWYRSLVDAKYAEVSFYRSEHGVDWLEAARQVLGFDIRH